MFIHFHGDIGPENSIFTGLRIHGNTHSWGTFQEVHTAIIEQENWQFNQSPLIILVIASNNEVMLVLKYFETDVTLLGFTVPNVGFLIVKDPNTLLEPQHNTQLLGVIGCNLIQLGCEEFGRVYGMEALKKFCCPDNIHPVIFAQMCSFYHQGKLSLPQTGSANQNLNLGSIKVNTLGISSKSERKIPGSGSDAILGQVWMGSTHEAICILANTMRVLQGKTNKITWKLSCMIKARRCNNLPLGLVVN